MLSTVSLCRESRHISSSQNFLSYIAFIESRGRVVNTLTSYSGGPYFKSRPRDRLP
jgi:hypothetical protein